MLHVTRFERLISNRLAIFHVHILFHHVLRLCYDFYNFRYPGDHFESTRIIGEKQSNKAIELFQSAKEQIRGKIAYKQTYVDMTNLSVKLSSGKVVTTCPAAVGFSFAAGTTDGPGAFDFTQADDQVSCYSFPAMNMVLNPQRTF